MKFMELSWVEDDHHGGRLALAVMDRGSGLGVGLFALLLWRNCVCVAKIPESDSNVDRLLLAEQGCCWAALHFAFSERLSPLSSTRAF